jgi:hypothetical protein
MVPSIIYSLLMRIKGQKVLLNFRFKSLIMSKLYVKTFG